MTTTSRPIFTRAASLGVCFLTLWLAHPALGQNYAFTTFAGAPGGSGSSDGRSRDARFDSPNGVAVDGDGNVFVADTNNHTIRKIAADGTVSTLAGSAANRGSADGTGGDARFRYPRGVAVDSGGTLFVTDSGNNTIRKISASGVVTTFAGGAGSAARFNNPNGIAVDRSGNLFVADVYNYTIRKIAADGTVTTLAGSAGASGFADGTGSAARFEDLHGLAVDASGNIYVPQGYGGGSIRKITAAGVVTTLAGLKNHFDSTDGPGSVARFGNPYGVAADGDGNVFIADTYNHTIRRIAPDGVVSTLAGLAGDYGSVDGTASTARFNYPNGLAVDRSGRLFVADSGNHNIRQIAAGTVTTFAGGAGSGSNDGPADTARFNTPRSVAVDRDGNLYVTDSYNYAIRKISASGSVSTFAKFGAAFITDNLYGVAADARGNVFLAEAYEDSDWFVPNGGLIRRITAEGTVSTLAGSPDITGSVDGTGSAARFYAPQGVAVDALGNVFVADTGNQTIRKITAAGVVTTLAGSANRVGSTDGAGRDVRFNNPQGIAVDSLGNVFVADTGNHTIRKIGADGVVTTLAGSAGNRGSADGTGRAAQFYSPLGVAVDLQGNLFVADTSNHTIRRIAADGIVTTVAGLADHPGSADGLGGAARFNSPTGVAVDGSGRLFVADSGNHTLRRGTLFAAPAIATQPQSQTVARGRTVMLSAAVSSSPAPTYQWTRNGIALAGATDATLVLAEVTAASAGDYQCLVTNAAGSTATAPATVTIVETIDAGRFNNFSVRAALDAGRRLVAGFVVDAPRQKSVLIRGVGPALASFGVSGALTDPRLEIFNGAGARLAENDDWPAGLAGTFAAAGAFAFPAGGKDAAILLALPPGAYTAVLSGVDGATGEALIELYEVP